MPKKVVIPQKQIPPDKTIAPIKKNYNVQKRTIVSKQSEKILIENFVSLQKVMTNLAIRFDALSHQISKLLELFEISAKSLTGKDLDLGNRDIEKKLDSILEQNKVIARGLALVHEKPEQNFQQSQTSTPQLQQQFIPEQSPPRFKPLPK